MYKETPYVPALRLRVGLGVTDPMDGESGDSPKRRRTIRPKGTPDWHLLVIFEGEFTVNLKDGNSFQLFPGQAILYPANTEQDYMLSENCSFGKTFWAHFFPEASMLRLLKWPQYDDSVGVLSWGENPQLNENIQHACNRCVSYFDSDYHRKKSLALLTLEEVLLLISQVNPLMFLDSLDDRVAVSILFIANNITERITLKDVAEEAGLSTSRLSHLFQTNLNCSVMSYLEKQRIQIATTMLLQSKVPISQVAQDCGFSSPYYFSKRFKQIKKMSPKQYRDIRNSPDKQGTSR